MARPPRRPVRPADRRVLAIFLATAVVISAIAFAVTFWPRDENDPPAPTPLPTVDATATVAPTPTAADEAIFSRPCGDACLVRLGDNDPEIAALRRRGLDVAFAAGDWLWTGARAVDVDTLRREGTRVAVVAETVESLRLYAVRASDSGAADLISSVGEIVDRAGNEYVVRVPKVPPRVSVLTDAGIWVEKFPPFAPPAADDLPPANEDLPPLTEGYLTDLVWSVNLDRLYQSMIDLQAMSSTDGSGIGTRHYTSTGNVMAAEYIYGALASYGVRVWYEDFLTDEGLLALNVVGEIPGRDPSAVYLVLAHFDSLNPADLSSSPGADDNATGVAGLLEIARLLAGYELAHPVRFFATNVEEVGLQGVKAFAARAASEGTPIAGAFNLDAVGSAAQGSQIVLNTDEAGVWLEDLMARVNDQYGLGQSILARVNPNIVADDNFLRDYGYPTVLVARELFGWSTLHHTVDDTVETVDLYNVRMAAALVLGAVANLVVVS